jgi:2-haloacid dehalogenase
VTRDALAYSANAMNLELTPDNQRRLLDTYLHLTPWPDTVATLELLRRSGIRVIALSNFSPAMLRANAEHAHILDLLDAFVSTDENRMSTRNRNVPVLSEIEMSPLVRFPDHQGERCLW